MVRLLAILSLLVGVLGVSPPRVAAMACCMGGEERTFREKAADADLVLYGVCATPGQLGSDGKVKLPEKLVFYVLRAIKSHRILKKRNALVFDRVVPIENPKRPPGYLLFFDVQNGQLEISDAIQTRSGKVADYVQDTLTLIPNNKRNALRYFSRHLEAADAEIARDAHLEFAKARYNDLRAVAKNLPADRILKRLQDPKTPRYRIGLYALLLGHCGTAKHAIKLRKMLDHRVLRVSPGYGGFLTAYTLLRPKEGLAYVREQVLAKRNEQFLFRYAGLRTARFFWEHRPDVLTRRDMIGWLRLLLEQDDLADFTIEDIRKWQLWELSDEVFALARTKSRDNPVIRKALVRYALSCPAWQTKAVNFIKAERKRDREFVADIEELLKEEEPSPPPSKPSS
jgi:hypothetical protein